MKVSNVLTLLFGSSLLLSAGAFAGNTNKKPLHLTDSVTVQGKQLKPGTYTVEWNGTGPDVEVNIVKGSKTVATVSAHVVAVNTPNKQDGYTSLAGKDGAQSVTQFFFRGEKFDLELGQVSGANATPGANTSGTN
ncbi:MAG: hypothetical protein ACYDCG_19190 [Candidatus Acidiferrales bacterium]